MNTENSLEEQLKQIKNEIQIKVENNYYGVHCEKCGWIGSSEKLLGGGTIADTGDHDDCYCPSCYQIDPEESNELTIEDYKKCIESMTNIIIGLRDQIEKQYWDNYKETIDFLQNN